MLQVLSIQVCLRTFARHWMLRGRRYYWQHRPGRLQSWLQQTVFITERPAALVHQGAHQWVQHARRRQTGQQGKRNHSSPCFTCHDSSFVPSVQAEGGVERGS